MIFPVVMYGCESWTIKKKLSTEELMFWIVVLEKTLESPLDCKEIQPVHPKGNQAWIFIGRTDAETETPIFWLPDVKNWLIGKDPDAGKDWRLEEKGTTENEMVEWHHQLNGHEFESTPGVSDAQGGLACCSPWGHKESDMTERLNSSNGRSPEYLPTTIAVFDSTHFTTLDTSYKWNHAIVVFLNGLFHLAYCPQASPVVLKSI